MIPGLLDSPLLRPRDPAAERAKAESARAREDFAAFVERVGCDNRGQRLQLDTFARIMVALLDGARREGRWLNVKTPPGLGKSVFARLFLAWLVGHDPTLTVGLIAGDDKAAEDGCGLCREIVLTSEYRGVFPNAIPDVERSRVKGKASDARGWRRDGWFLTAAGQRKDPTMGAYASVPKREDLSLNVLFADDLITERTANSVAESERIEKAWWNTWVEGRLRPGGFAIYLQNHRLDGDLGDKIRKDRRFVSAYAGVTESSRMFLRVWNPLARWPAIPGLEQVEPADDADVEWEFDLPSGRLGWNATELALKNRRAFDQLYRLRGAAPEDLMFPSWEKRRTVRSVDGFIAGRLDATWVAGVDISGTGRAGNAVTLCARRGGPDGGIVIGASERFRRLEEAMEWLNRQWENGIRFQAVMVESNGVQVQVLDLLRTLAKGREWEWQRKMEPTLTGREKMDASGLPILETMLSRGEIVTAEDAECRGLWSDMATLRIETCRRAGKTPDSVMSLWFAVRKLDRMRIGSDGGSRKISAVTRPEVVL